MIEIARRSIDELLARYDLEPELNDIYVEGKFDQDILLKYISTTPNSNIKVYDIDSVDVPPSLVISHGLTDGNKQRVMVLAREFAKQLPKCSCCCLVDKDLDHWFSSLETTEKLVWTEFCSLELYFWTDEILRDVVLTAAKTKINAWDEYIESMITTLRDLYALRLADRELGWSIEWLPIDRCLSHEGSKIVFNLDDYIDRLLNKNRKIGSRSQFVVSATDWKSKLAGDHRDHIRGHDFVELLAWSISKFRGIKEFSSSVSIERLFVLLAPKITGLGNLLHG